jgi:hypothetical protein
MSYQEKRSIANIISSILIIAVYSAYMIQRYPEGGAYSTDVFHFWGAFFLILIPVSVVARIIIYIIFHILNAIATREEDVPITDERDRIIELKGTQISLYVFSVGFILAMVSLVLDMPPAAMFIILICSGIASEIVSEAAQFFFYRRGV